MISLFHFANLGNNFDLEIRSLDYCFRSTFSIPMGPQFNPERDVTKDISFGFGAAGCWGGLGLSVSWWGALYLTSLTPLFIIIVVSTVRLLIFAAESYIFTVVVTFCRSFLVKSFCFVSFTLIEKSAIANTRKSPQEPSTVQMTTVPPAGG